MSKGRIIEQTPIKTIGLVIAGILISVAIWQVRIYYDILRRARQNKLKVREAKPRDLQFLVRQALRRLQMHVLLGLAGMGMLFGIYLPPKQAPLFWAIVWFAVLFLLCWAMLLAGVDFVSIKLYYLGMERQDRIEKIQREYELHQVLKKQKENAENTKSPDSGIKTNDKDQ